MNLKGRLEHLAHMSMKDRAMGRTTLIAKAAAEVGGIVIARSHDEAKRIERTFKVPARSMELNLEGFSGPFFLDHHATETLLLKAASKIDELENQIVEIIKLKNAENEMLLNEVARVNRQLEATMHAGKAVMEKLIKLQQDKK